MPLDQVGNLNLFQFSLVINELENRDKASTYNALIAARGANLEGDAFSALLAEYIPDKT